MLGREGSADKDMASNHLLASIEQNDEAILLRRIQAVWICIATYFSFGIYRGFSPVYMRVRRRTTNEILVERHWKDLVSAEVDLGYVSDLLASKSIGEFLQMYGVVPSARLR